MSVKEAGGPDIQRALRWAVKLHRGQFRDGAAPLPYASHPVDVMNRLRYVGGVENPDVLCAALLHDAVEECGVPLEKIEAKFGASCASLVREMTRTEPDEARIRGLREADIWELRSDLLLHDILAMTPAAMAIKLADRASNLEAALATRTGEQRARYIRQSYMILEAIPRAVSAGLWDSIERMLSGAVNGRSGTSQPAAGQAQRRSSR